jgi:hypothetical protein
MSNLYHEVSKDAYSSTSGLDIEKILSNHPPANASQLDNGVSNVIDFFESLMSGNMSDKMSGNNVDSITFQTLLNDNASSEYNFVALKDMSLINTASALENQGENEDNNEVVMSSEPMHQLYYAGLGLLGILLLYKVMRLSK